MKVLKYILFFIIALVIIFFAFGLLMPEVEYGHEITVNKPVEEAWAVSEDPEKYDQWLKGFQSMELLSGEYGEVGSTYKVVVNPGEGQEDFVMTETIISKEVNDHIEMHFDSEMMDFEQVMLFSEKDGNTTIKTESKVMGKGAFLKSMFAMMETMGNAFEKQEAENMENLKIVIEKNETDYFPAPPVEEVMEETVSE